MELHNRRAWFFRLIALTGAIVVAGVCVEVLLRVMSLDRPLIWQPHPQLGWWHVPGARAHWTEEGDGHIVVNSLSMRDEERTVAKPAGVFRIAVFGDSMTEGVQVEPDQTFTQLLQRKLRQRGFNVEVLNFGVNGYSPLQGYLLFDYVGKRFSPDLVLHAVFTDNDIADGDPQLAAGQVGAPFARMDSSPKLSLDYSRTEESVSDYRRQPRYLIRRFSATYRMLAAMRRANAAQVNFGAMMTSTGGIPRRYLVYADPVPPQWAAAWNLYERILATFAADVGSIGARFAVVSVPAGQVVDERAWNRIFAEYPEMQGQRWQMLGPETRLAAITARQGVALIQPLDDFRKNIGGASMFFGNVGHFTPRGHEIMAEALERYLTRSGWLPAPAVSGAAR
jgi:lysophospholipase L1-like esterase